jgi:cell division septation protein DedD
MPDKGQSGTNEALRIGGQNSVLMYNRQSDDATLPDMSPQGTATSVALPTGSWQCFEYLLSTNGTIETWLNGAAIAGLTVGPGISNPNSNGWGSSYKPNVQGVYFGWESYSGTPNTFWYDDIVISSSRVGCSGTTTGGSPPPPPPPASSSSSAVVSPPPASSSSSATAVTSSTTLATTTKKSTTTTTTTTTTTAVSSPTGATQTLYGQCGGIGYSGPTVCAAPASCVSSNPYYSQCLSR